MDDIKVVPYQEGWITWYEQEEKSLRDILGSNLVECHHIGSTAVPGLCAKPIIDIIPVVSQMSSIGCTN